jgi:hypothetical protein
MAGCVLINSRDKKTLARAAKLRDAAVMLRALMQEWQPGVCVSSAQCGPFRVRYHDLGTGSRASTKGLNARAAGDKRRPLFGLEVAREKALLRTEWDAEEIVLTLFRRGDWEGEFLRLASRQSCKATA